MNKKILFALLSAALAALVYFFLPASCPESARRTAAVFVLAAVVALSCSFDMLRSGLVIVVVAITLLLVGYPFFIARVL